MFNSQKIIVHIQNAGKKKKKTAAMSKGSSHVLWRWDLLSKPFVSLLFVTPPFTLSCAPQIALRRSLSLENHFRHCEHATSAHLHGAIHFLDRLESGGMSGEEIKHIFKLKKLG